MSEREGSGPAVHHDDPLPTGVGGSPQPRGTVEQLVVALEHVQRDRYRTEGVFARGGMGSVERVVDRTLLRHLALKRMYESLQANEQQAHMFVREARVTGQLQHPSIVPVLELGVDEDRSLYYTMELVGGRTVEAWIAALPPPPLDRSTLFDLLDVVVRMCEALAFAHSRGILHCDIKPANVMVGEFGQVYLMDWGIARMLDEERARDPEEPLHTGTPTHMAPEQARGEPIDVRADVFAVGSFMYQIATRRPPFHGETYFQALVSAALCEYQHPDSVPEARGIPPALTPIIVKAMAPLPADRYQSIAELRDALVRFMRGVDAFPRVSVAAGDDVIREGDTGTDAFVIESGSCEVHRLVDGQRTSIRVMHAGAVFGEMAILSPGARTATVTALEPTTLLRITAETLEAEVDTMKPWMGALVRSLAARFRDRDGGR